MDEEFDKRSDGLFIQRLFVQMMLATMPVDGPAFQTNQEYMIKKGLILEPWTIVGGNPAKFIKKRILKDVPALMHNEEDADA